MGSKKRSLENPAWTALTEFPTASSTKKLMAFVGGQKKNLGILQHHLFGLSLSIVDGQVAAPTATYNALKAKHASFEGLITMVFADLSQKVFSDPGYTVDAQEIEAATARARARLESVHRIAQTVPLTSDKLTSGQLAELVGENDMNLRKIAEDVGHIVLDVSEGRVVIEDLQLSALDAGAKLRLQFLLSSLETIVLSGGKISHDNIKQAAANASVAQNAAMNGVAKVTTTGMQINKKDTFPENLTSHPVFEPQVVIETSDDPTFSPARILTFSKAGGDVQRVMLHQSGDHLRRLRDASPGCVLFADKNRLIIRGTPEATAFAETLAVSFASLLHEKGWKEKIAVAQILSVVLGEAETYTLDSFERRKQTKDIAQTTESNRGEIKKFFEKLTLQLYEGRTENQRTYLDILKDDDNSLVLAQGPAGTGKTVLFLQTAISKLRDHYLGVPGVNFQRIVLSYPLVSNGQKVGFLPGDLQNKTGPKFRTYYDHLARILAPVDKDGYADEIEGQKALDFLMERKVISIELLEDMMGKSYPNAIVVLDEAQNSEPEQMISLLTRPEETSRLFVFGDIEQCYLGAKKDGHNRYDVPSTIQIKEDGMVYIRKNTRLFPLGNYMDVGKFTTKGGRLEYVTPNNGFAEAFLLYSDLPGVACCLLEHKDIQRSGLGQKILEVRRALRDARVEVTSSAPHGRGDRCVQTILADCARETPKRAAVGAVVPITSGAKYGS